MYFATAPAICLPQPTRNVGADIFYAAHLLRAGEVVAIPTETVYGLAGNAYDERVVRKIFEVKRRPNYDPLIVHTDRLEKVYDFVLDIPEAAHRLAECFMPGPLTLLLPRKKIIPDLVTSGLDTVAVRLPNHYTAQILLSQLDFPLAAPSANPFGYISPTSAVHVFDQLGALIPYILDGGICGIGIESTIVGFQDGVPTVYRLGGVSLEELTSVLGTLAVRTHSVSNPAAPGLLMSHYAPRTPLFLGVPTEVIHPYVGYISLNRYDERIPAHHQMMLSPSGDLWEAARNLYGALRSLDRLGLEAIYAETMPAYGPGPAMNDRLKRACAPVEKF